MFANLLAQLRQRKIDPSGQPPMLTSDRAPTFRESEDRPFVRFYNPDSLNFPDKQGPIVPGHVPGTCYYGMDTARIPQASWDRSCDGSAQNQFFKTYVKSGLTKV